MTDCSELEVKVLNNKEALCWFDSATFALFHKERSELDTLFKTHEGPAFKILKSMYDHFTNIKPLPSLRTTVNDFRKNSEIQNIFNMVEKSIYTVKETINNIKINESNPPQTLQNVYTLNKDDTFNAENSNNSEVQKTIKLNEVEHSVKFKLDIVDLLKTNKIEEKQKGKVTFDIQTTQGDDPGNFFRGIMKFSPFETVQKNGKTENSLYPKSAEESTLLDLHFINEISKENTNYENTHTIIINRQGIKDSKTLSNFLEIIVLPIKDKSTEYTLDAVILHTGQFHYVVFVRCGNSKKWVYYNDSTAEEEKPINKDNVINSFEEMRNFKLSGYTNVSPNSHFQYLIYSRKS